jgi:hypothetical protein
LLLGDYAAVVVGEAIGHKAHTVEGKSFFFTHFAAVDNQPFLEAFFVYVRIAFILSFKFVLQSFSEQPVGVHIVVIDLQRARQQFDGTIVIATANRLLRNQSYLPVVFASGKDFI